MRIITSLFCWFWEKFWKRLDGSPCGGIAIAANQDSKRERRLLAGLGLQVRLDAQEQAFLSPAKGKTCPARRSVLLLHDPLQAAPATDHSQLRIEDGNSFAVAIAFFAS